MKLTATPSGDFRALIAAEIAGAEKAVTAGVRAAAAGLKDRWRGQANPRQIFGDMDERSRVLMRRRRIHQHHAAAVFLHPVVFAERSVAREPPALGAAPARFVQEGFDQGLTISRHSF